MGIGNTRVWARKLAPDGSLPLMGIGNVLASDASLTCIGFSLPLMGIGNLAQRVKLLP